MSAETEFKRIKGEADYDAALEAIDRLMGAAPNTPEGDALEALVTLVEAYEAIRWPLEATGDPTREPFVQRTLSMGLRTDHGPGKLSAVEEELEAEAFLEVTRRLGDKGSKPK